MTTAEAKTSLKKLIFVLSNLIGGLFGPAQFVKYRRFLRTYPSYGSVNSKCACSPLAFVGYLSFCFEKAVNAPRWRRAVHTKPPRWEYSPQNDPDPEMIPNPEMIPKSTPKCYRLRNDLHFSSRWPRNDPQLILGMEWCPKTMDRAKCTTSQLKFHQ